MLLCNDDGLWARIASIFMNIRINLLPWRDEQRRQAKKRGKILLVIAFVIGLAIVFLINGYVSANVVCSENFWFFAPYS